MGLLLAILLFAGDCPSPPTTEVREEAYRRYVSGQVAVNEDRFADAVEPLQRSAAADPLLPHAPYALGQAMMGLRRFPEAVAAFTASGEAFRCWAESTKERRAEVAKGLDRQIRELQDAIRSIERDGLVAASTPWQEMNNSPRRSRGETMRLVQQLEERLSRLREWRRRGPDPRRPATVSLALGTALFQAGAPVDAERELRAALNVDPRNGDAHHNLAVVYLAMGRIPEAERELRLAERAGVEVNPRLRDEIRKRTEADKRR